MAATASLRLAAGRPVLLTLALLAGCGSKDAVRGGDDAGPVVVAAPPPKVSKPTESAIEALKKVKEPRALLFFPPGPAADQVLGYLTDLGAKAGVSFEVRELDRLIQVEEARRFRVTRDGLVVLISGERSESIQLHPDGPELEGDLARLDGRVVRELARLRGARQVAVVRHEAAGAAGFTVLEQGLKALGFEASKVAPGKDVPAGAIAIFVDVGAGPTGPAMESIDRHLAAGGAALVAIEPRKGASLGPLEARLGLALAAGTLVDPQAHAVRRRDRSDHTLVMTSGIKAHASLATVGRLPLDTTALLFATGGALVERDPPPGVARTVTIRSMPTAFLDLDGNLAPGRREPATTHPIAAAASGPFKAIVVADASWLSDEVLQAVSTDQALLVDAVRWLAGEEEFSQRGGEEPATGTGLTSYPVRSVPVAGPRGALWKVAPDGVHGVRYETRGRVVLLERRDGRLWGRVERPSAGAGAAPVREFPLAPEASKLLAALAEPVPLRAVGPLDATTRARYALEDGTLTVDLAGGATHTIMVGARVMGSGDRYAAAAGGKSVVILPASLIDPIDQTDRIALRRVLELDPTKLSRLVVSRDGRTREAVKAPDGGWKVTGGGSDDAYLAEEIARAAFVLTPTEFAPAERAKEMTAAGRLGLTAGSAAPVDLELFTRGDEFWIRTPLTGGLYGRVSAGSARRIADAIDQLTGSP